MERIVSATEENPIRENIMEVWKNYTIEDATFAIQKVKAIKPETITSFWRNCPDAAHDFTGFTAGPIKEIMTDCGCGKGGWCRVSGHDLGEIQELIDCIPEEFAENNLMELSVSESVSDYEEEERKTARKQLISDSETKDF